jgi:hypothetical protein
MDKRPTISVVGSEHEINDAVEGHNFDQSEGLKSQEPPTIPEQFTQSKILLEDETGSAEHRNTFHSFPPQM